MALTLHHVGCLVEDIPAALAAFPATSSSPNVAAPVEVASQKVSVCFLPAGNGTFIEFVQPWPENGFLLKMMRKGISYYHAGYLCRDLEESVQSLVAAGAHELNRFQSEAFEGRCCVFVITGQQQLIELIQAP
jgi:hypothetical protein